jgi:phospholipid/cholesterol/gamma-HCH transport system permease protein
MAAEAAFDFREEERAPVLALRGDWTVDTIAGLETSLREIAQRLKPGAVVDVAALGRIDVAGAYLLDRTFRESPAGEGERIAVRGKHEHALSLLAAARKAASAPAPEPERTKGFKGFLEGVGHVVADLGQEVVESVDVLGEVLVMSWRLITKPRRIRWVSLVHIMEVAGLNALPIVLVLSFFLGMVVAYLGARILRDFGATVFTVDLVAFSVLREFAVLVAAILLAGRSGSAFTAEIGAMKMRQEIDAMRVIGIQPMEALVVPRVWAMVVMTPILTFAGMMSGLFGGIVVCWLALDIGPAMFLGRMAETVPEQHFWVGMLKAPAFAVAIAVIACKQGLSVGGDVASLGNRVTSSVVQSIFMVILMDALFALWFLEVRW